MELNTKRKKIEKKIQRTVSDYDCEVLALRFNSVRTIEFRGDRTSPTV